MSELINMIKKKILKALLSDKKIECHTYVTVRPRINMKTDV